jgi:hypothetical protein
MNDPLVVRDTHHLSPSKGGMVKDEGILLPKDDECLTGCN